MKKILFCLVFSLIVSATYAQGMYFDAGLGLGAATTEVNGNDVSDPMGSDVTEVAIDLGLKIGYGPINNSPVYIGLDISGVGHRFEDDYNYVQYNSYLLGPTIMIYPSEILQLSASFGTSWIDNKSDLGDMYGSDSYGYAASVSAALDLGGRHGILLGLKYFYSSNTLEVTKVEQTTSMIGLFFKYRFRHLPQSSNW